MQSWQTAGEQFRNSEAGKSWPGGEANQQILAKIIRDNNLTDGIEGDKVAALVAAYEYARENNLLVENEADAYKRRILDAKTPEELRQAAGYQDPSMRPNNLWGR
jgi:hypothetical protein